MKRILKIVYALLIPWVLASISVVVFLSVPAMRTIGRILIFLSNVGERYLESADLTDSASDQNP